ncbi:hypothetical protein DSCO28_01800 [Desulfosarcina ovata subsp. sediminis]|uniref:Gamma-glutamylcyclotransferase n=1 Tax=Desulfosarcina ovata subsp. sediminis TaxID=885957 RepID=A0A5K7ZED2_9BACT|nr:hypothetical protein [Desulfosarcina ovata]BBO79614.1 hypothetical protein DSCO28_01800 [Desulfosarcina ovata subsp. sediminis]
MPKIGILAYGSLIEDPGGELSPYIVKKIPNVATPFNIEFARKSRKRGDGPTVIPVKNGGSSVKAYILELNDNIDIEKAKDLLWRRETGDKDSNSHYALPKNQTVNHVIIESISDYPDFDHILYTNIGSNIDNLDPVNLAKLAIDSAKSSAGEKGEDGINYLLSVKRQGILTPLMPDYEKEILKQTDTESLEEAISKIRKEVEHNKTLQLTGGS